MTTRTSLLRAIVGCMVAGVAALASAQTSPATINRAAIGALEKMSAYLNTLQSFEVQSTTTIDEVLDNGQKVQFGGTVDFKVRRPNQFRVEILNDRKHRVFIYDGKTVTLFGPRVNFYSTVPAPPTIAGVLDALGANYGIEIPLADLFYWGTEKGRVADITEADHIGPATIDGAACDHYAFRQQGVDWQIWIQKGSTPLPRKLVITTTNDPTQPQFSSQLRWKTQAQHSPSDFVFTAPKSAHRIVMLTVDANK